MTRKLNEQVVVITGASTGIGRETALECARRGARVVLAARNETGLQAAVAEITRQGGQAVAVTTDVADFGQVERLAQQAVTAFGRIDTWVNNAGISQYATVEQSSVEELSRIIQVNLMGVMHGVKAVLPYLARQGHGTIINVASGLGERAVPLQAAYCSSKFGVKGFTEALRMELAREHPGLRVTLVLPSSINTPLFGHARSRLGVKPMPLPPVYPPEAVARAIAFAAENPRRDIFVGSVGRVLAWLERLSPSLLDWLMVQNGLMFRLQRSGDPDNGRDNLFAPIYEAGSTTGEWGKLTLPSSPYTNLFELHPTGKRMLLAAAAAGTLAFLRRKRS